MPALFINTSIKFPRCLLQLFKLSDTAFESHLNSSPSPFFFHLINSTVFAASLSLLCTAGKQTHGMILYTTWFSERGRELAARITELSLSVSYGFWQSRYGGHPAVSKIQIRERGNRSLPDFLEEAFAQQFPVIFIGALGIAVRAIAPLIRHKTVDSPVLVLDEAGQFVIPVLSGHLGGANELAQQIAESLHSAAVVTTATDVNGLFAVDVFARKNGLRVCNPEAIRHVSGKLLQGEIIVMAVDPACMSPEEMAEITAAKGNKS